MTTEIETTTKKKPPAFYIFVTVEVDGEHERRNVGAAFAHRTGNSFNIVCFCRR